MLDEERAPTLPPNAYTRNYVIHFSNRHTRDCMINITKTLNDNVASFPDGLYSETQVQLPAQVL